MEFKRSSIRFVCSIRTHAPVTDQPRQQLKRVAELQLVWDPCMMNTVRSPAREVKMFLSGGCLGNVLTVASLVSRRIAETCGGH